MIDFKYLSTQQLRDCQKLLDETSQLSARLMGMKEAMNMFLPPEIVNSMEYRNLQQALSTYVSGQGLPIPIYLRGLSAELEKEILRREK